MSDQPSLVQITDRAVKDVSQRVAKMEMVNADLDSVAVESPNSLVTTARGDYELTIVFCAGTSVLRAITENMKRGQATDETDIAAYTKEFFNILCGHVVSTFNRATHTSARFTVPEMIEGEYLLGEAKETGMCSDLFYQSRYGPVLVRTLFWNHRQKTVNG